MLLSIIITAIIASILLARFGKKATTSRATILDVHLPEVPPMIEPVIVPTVEPVAEPTVEEAPAAKKPKKAPAKKKAAKPKKISE